MINLDEAGLRSGGFAPNVYIKRVTLNRGSSVDSKLNFASELSSRVSETTRDDGTLVYRDLNPQDPHNDGGSLSVTLDLQLKDVMNPTTRQGTWITDLTGRSQTVISILQSTNPQLTEELISGSFFDDAAHEVPQGYNRLIDYDILKVSLTKNPDNPDRTTTDTNGATGNIIISLHKRARFDIPQENPNHLTYFVMSEKDPDQRRRNSTKVHSIVSIEKVMDNGLPVTQAYVYKDSDNNIWSGPVHLHPTQGWMEGAFHVSFAHRPLTQSFLNNFKIQDMRVFSEIGDYSLDLGVEKEEYPVYFSPLYPSRKENGDLSLMFTFDHLKYMIQNSKFGKLYRDSSQALQAQLLRQARILELSVERHRVLTHNAVNRLESSIEEATRFTIEAPPDVFAISADQDGTLLSRKRYVIDGEDYNKFTDLPGSEPPPTSQMFYGSLEELSVDYVGNLRTFAAVDGALSRITDGKYQYALNISLQDGAFEYLKHQLSTLDKTIELAKAYLAVAEKRGNHNSSTGELTSEFAATQAVSATSTPVWMGAIVVFMEMLDLVTDIAEPDKRAIADKLYSVLNPTFTSVSIINAFVESMQQFSQKFETLISNSKEPHTRNKSNIAQSSLKDDLQEKYIFKDSFESNVSKGTGFNYFTQSASTGELLVFTPEEYVDRIESELQRYTNNLYSNSDIIGEFSFMSDAEAQALSSLDHRYSYMAPRTIKLNNTNVNLQSENKEELDFSSVTAAIQKVLNGPSTREVDLTLDRKTRGLLTETGTGPTTERLLSLTNVYFQTAQDSGLLLHAGLSDSIVKETSSENGSTNLLNSEGLLGANNAFTSVEDTPQRASAIEDRNGSSSPLALLKRLFKFEVSGIQNTGSIQTPSLNNISFDLSRSDNFINKRIRPNAPSELDVVVSLQRLPQQIKLLTRNRERVYQSTAARLTTATDSQTDAFIYNFSLIRAVEYLSYVNGYPVWQLLNEGALTNVSKGLLCRLRRYEDPNTNIGAFEELDSIPVFNEVFIVQSDAAPTQPPVLDQQTTVPSAGDAFQTRDLLNGPEAAIIDRFITLEEEKGSVQYGVEYIQSQIPGAPAGLAGRFSGLSRNGYGSAPTTTAPSATAPGTTAAPTPPTTNGQGY
jgi:hypothetical protein